MFSSSKISLWALPSVKIRKSQKKCAWTRRKLQKPSKADRKTLWSGEDRHHGKYFYYFLKTHTHRAKLFSWKWRCFHFIARFSPDKSLKYLSSQDKSHWNASQPQNKVKRKFVYIFVKWIICAKKNCAWTASKVTLSPLQSAPDGRLVNKSAKSWKKIV